MSFCTNMSKARCLSLMVTIIGLVTIMEVDGLPTVDDRSSCEATALDENVEHITIGFTEVKIQGSMLYRKVNQMHEDLAEVKNKLRSPLNLLRDQKY